MFQEGYMIRGKHTKINWVSMPATHIGNLNEKVVIYNSIKHGTLGVKWTKDTYVKLQNTAKKLKK